MVLALIADRGGYRFAPQLYKLLCLQTRRLLKTAAGSHADRNVQRDRAVTSLHCQSWNMITAACRSAGVCALCELRHLGVRDSTRYDCDVPGVVPCGDAARAPPCVICLGVLQTPTLQSVARLARDAFSTVTHDGRFKVNVALPAAATLVRDRAFKAFLLAGAKNVAHGIGFRTNCPSIENLNTKIDVSDVVSLREAFKWSVCTLIENVVGASYHPDAELFCDVVFSHADTQSEPALLVLSHEMKSYSVKKRQRPYSSNADLNGTRDPPSIVATQRALDAMTVAQLFDALGPKYFPPGPVASHVAVDVTVSIASFVVGGKYNKFSRRISQTPWFVDDHVEPDDVVSVRAENGSQEICRSNISPDLCDKKTAVANNLRQVRTDYSVEEVIVSGLKHVFRPERTTFTAGGREDIDVRMLGDGRPFIVELVNPCIVGSLVTPEMIAEAGAFNHAGKEAVKVRDFRLVSKKYVSSMRTCEADKRKHYRCVIWTSRMFRESEVRQSLESANATGGLLLRQKTPLRVLHRRTLLDRERRIYELRLVRFVNPQTFVLDVYAAAGTYIKEFVHGDNGRTVPNVGQLLNCDADILQLDVASIELDA